MEKRTKDNYGPPMGKRLLVVLDDMNMPKVAAPAAHPHKYKYLTKEGKKTQENDHLRVILRLSRWTRTARSSPSRS